MKTLLFIVIVTFYSLLSFAQQYFGLDNFVGNADIKMVNEEVGIKEVLKRNQDEKQTFISDQVDTAVTAQPDQIDFVGGFGFIYSWDYNEVLKDTYSSYDLFGGWGWWDFQFGVRFKTSEQFFITPSFDLLVNYVSLPSKIFFNTIILPSVSCQYSFSAKPSFYFRVEVNYGIFNTGGRIEAESDGVGFGGAIGYTWRGGTEVQLGYLHVPVNVQYMGGKNFGGVFLKWNRSF